MREASTTKGMNMCIRLLVRRRRLIYKESREDELRRGVGSRLRWKKLRETLRST